MLVDAVLKVTLKDVVDSKSLKYAREIANVIFQFYTKRNVILVEINSSKDENGNDALMFIFFDEQGIIEVEERHHSLVNRELNMMAIRMFNEAYVSSDPLIYKTKYYKNGSKINEHIWGYTINSSALSITESNELKSLSSSTDAIVNNIRNDILNLTDDGYIGIKDSKLVMQKIKQQYTEYEEVEDCCVVIKTNKTRYEVEQSLLD